MRTFLALPLPPKLASRLGEESDRLRLTGAEVAWTRPENHHLTLRFLGDLDGEDLYELDPLLAEAIAAVSGPLHLVAKGLGHLPVTGSRPRTVTCGVVLGEEAAARPSEAASDENSAAVGQPPSSPDPAPSPPALGPGAAGGALHELHAGVDAVAHRYGLRREKGPFRPHVTLGRVRGEDQLEKLVDRLGPGRRREFGHWRASEVILYDSVRTPEGVRYEALRHFPLGKKR